VKLFRAAKVFSVMSRDIAEPFNTREIAPEVFAEYVFPKVALYNHFPGRAADSGDMRAIERFLF
jgi:hypothetical protein